MDTNKSTPDTSESEYIKDLKRQIINLQSQLDIERSISQNKRGINLLLGEPIDLYPGEQSDFLISILEQVKQKCAPNSRQYDIICSILSKNKKVGKGDEILRELNRIFTKNTDLNDADIACLNNLGFTYTPSRKHPKLRFHDRYMYVLPSSPSDRRSSKNIISEMSKCIAIDFKI